MHTSPMKVNISNPVDNSYILTTVTISINVYIIVIIITKYLLNLPLNRSMYRTISSKVMIVTTGTIFFMMLIKSRLKGE